MPRPASPSPQPLPRGAVPSFAARRADQLPLKRGGRGDSGAGGDGPTGRKEDGAGRAARHAGGVATPTGEGGATAGRASEGGTHVLLVKQVARRPGHLRHLRQRDPSQPGRHAGTRALLVGQQVDAAPIEGLAAGPTPVAQLGHGRRKGVYAGVCGSEGVLRGRLGEKREETATPQAAALWRGLG